MFRLAVRGFCTAARAPGPLAGVRVLDLSRILAGPFCTATLGDMGADVIKIEKPVDGDDTRHWGPPFVAGESTYFLSVNRNKRSVCVDIGSPEGVATVLALSKSCDVLVENFLPGKLASMGLGYEHVKAANPRIIYASISGFGDDGPRMHQPGYDVAISALGGLMSITGSEGGPPAKVGVAVTDLMTGLYATAAINAALFHRNTSGTGQHISCSLLETQIAGLANIAGSVLNGGSVPQRRGTAHESIVPYQVFTAVDGELVVAAMSDQQFVKLCGAFNIPEVALDPRFSHNKDRVKNRAECVCIVQDCVSKFTRSDCLALLTKAGVTATPVHSVAEALSDPQVVHRKMVQTIKHPTAGDIRVTGCPVKFSVTECSIRLPPPTLGQHTEEVLQELSKGVAGPCKPPQA